MARIEKLQISGIRSYPPGKGGVIEFPTPLTIIVGHNGTGKTTIIESLNYVVANNLPPGCKGNAFIHDPKVAGEKEVKGQVKLKFVDVTGNNIVGIRSMSSTQKFKKIETKSLDGVILKKPKDGGEPQSISSRCTDFTKEMVSRLGVSKAVIENVIFCHQEDSNWPLSEGKVLKQKFDAIFAATRYIKALESIRNLRKEQGKEVKDFASQLGTLSELKTKAQEITSDLSKAEAQVTLANEKIQKINEKCIPIEAQIKEIDSKSEDVFAIENKISNLQSTQTEKKKHAANLDQNIENKFQGNLEELRDVASEFEDMLSKKQRSLEDLDVMAKRLNVEVNRFTETKTALDKEHGKLEQEANMQQNLVQERDELVQNISHKFQISGFDQSQFSSEEVNLFMTKLKEMYNDFVSSGKERRESFSKGVQESESKIKNLEKSLHNYEGIIEQKGKLMQSNEKKLKEVGNSLTSLEASENRLKSLENDCKKAEIELENFKKEMNSSAVRDEIGCLSDEKKKEEHKLTKLRGEEGKMIQQSKTQTKLEMLEKNKAEKDDTVQEILRRIDDQMKKIFGTRPPLQELKEKHSDFIQSKQREARKTVTQFQTIQKDIAANEAEKKMLMVNQKKNERELADNRSRLSGVCKENDYNEFREKVQQKVEKLQNTLVELKSFERIYQKYITDLRSNDTEETDCPLCHRRFETSREVKNLVDELAQKLQNVPGKREKARIQLDQEKHLSEEVQKLAPIKSRLDKLSEEVPKLSAKINEINEMINGKQEKLSEVEMMKCAVEDEENTGRSIEADVSKIDDYLFELKDLDKQLNLESNKLQGVVPGRTMQALREEVQEKQNDVDSLSRRVEQKREQLVEHQRQLSLREREKNELTSQKLKLESDLQKRLQLETQKADLSSTNQAYEREIRDARRQIPPIENSLLDEKEKKKNLNAAKEANEEDVRRQIERITRNGNQIRERNEKIERYISEGKENDLRDNVQQMNKVVTRLKAKADELRAKQKERDKIREELTKQGVRKRELEDNMQLMKMTKEIRDIDKKVEELQKELSKFGAYQEISKQRTTLQQTLDQHRKEKAVYEGRLSGFQDEVKRCQRDLAGSLYADAETKHCEKMIELRTTELANQDLDKYYKALDGAIMKYHGLKLAEINKIIKEYWIKTYKGNDIDTIEIVAENDEDGSGASKTRRSYNYRVCMIKSGISLDMRSRCSAGQKVLASIIIRLALAETFCLNCGILALDEPTTNLDEANISSLANSLRDIIEIRMQQKNFQLIVITHDEEFVQALGRSDFVDHYFRVYKDAAGHSKVHKMKMAEKE